MNIARSIPRQFFGVTASLCILVLIVSFVETDLFFYAILALFSLLTLFIIDIGQTAILAICISGINTLFLMLSQTQFATRGTFVALFLTVLAITRYLLGRLQTKKGPSAEPSTVIARNTHFSNHQEEMDKSPGHKITDKPTHSVKYMRPARETTRQMPAIIKPELSVDEPAPSQIPTKPHPQQPVSAIANKKARQHLQAKPRTKRELIQG